MFIKTTKSTFFLTKDRVIEETPVLFIHGFTGSSKSWSLIRNEINIPSLSLDIPGHNKSTFNDMNEDYFFKDFSNELYMILSQLKINKLHICGYSLGGRLAIAFASKYPSMIESLVLESTTIGIEDRQQREERYIEDIELSSNIKNNLPMFNKSWEKNKLFELQKKRNIEGFNEQKDIRQGHNKDQLSKSLKTFSVGNMPFMRNTFQKLEFPIHIINGKDDIKFIKEGRIMLRLNNHSKQYIVNNASHNVHLENKEMFTDIFNNIYN